MQTVKKINRKEEIFETATSLFKEKGYSATSMRDLATAMGMEAASLYSHIKSKEEILQKICFRMAEAFFVSLNKVTENYPTSREKLQKAIESHILVLTANSHASMVFLNEWKHMSDPYLNDFLQMRNDYEQRFLDIVKEGIQNGEFRSMDEKFTVLTILSSLNWIPNWYRESGKLTAEQIGNQLSNIILNGIKL